MKRSELSGKTIALAGTFPGLTHGAIKQALTSAGATVTSAISADTDVVFVGQRGGTKEAAARKLGLTLCDAAQLEAALAEPKAKATKTKATKATATKSAKPTPTKSSKPTATKATAKKAGKKASKKASTSASSSDSATPTAAKPASGISAFAGKKIVLTGAFVTMKRAEAQKLLADAGAEVGGSVSRTTELLIYGDKAGSKLAKARALGVAQMTEAEFVQQLQGSGAVSSDAAEKIAQAQKDEQQRMAKVTKAVERINAPQRRKYGATIPELLQLYLRVFAQRPDIHVYDHRAGRPTPSSTLRALQGDIPDEALAFAAGVGPLEFNWVFAEHKADRSQYSSGYRGGRIKLVGFENFRWWPKQSWQKEERFKEDAMFDDFVAEGNTRLSYDKGQKRTDAALVFDNANDVTRDPLGSIEGYITDGAKAGFTWYWQTGPGEFTDQLVRASVPRDTSPERLRALLQARGLSEDEARALVTWLGPDAVVLVHGSATAEGRAQASLAASFPMADVASSRSMDIEMVTRLASSSDPLPAAELATLLEGHRQFLAAGGAGGRWETLSVSGLPMCIYVGGDAGGGAQAVFRLKNIAGADLRQAALAYADLSGCYAQGADLTGADLTGSVAIDSVMEGARFDGATLKDVDLSGARLAGASFNGADLRGADLECADLRGADFRGAKLEGSRFPGAKLDDVTR
ncbi:MAG: pentapeptide repeat-containing protein [Myxococcales bacterium]|nr:pentapeptide repeat-containing protein [Myxococcales bacterium]